MANKQLTDKQYYLLMLIKEYQKRAIEYQDGIGKILEME